MDKLLLVVATEVAKTLIPAAIEWILQDESLVEVKAKRDDVPGTANFGVSFRPTETGFSCIVQFDQRHDK